MMTKAGDIFDNGSRITGTTAMRLFCLTGIGEIGQKMGGKWAADVKLWYIQYGKINGTELEKHIILDDFHARA
jgi:hypothetical protein